jgi:hypothetical protein
LHALYVFHFVLLLDLRLAVLHDFALRFLPSLGNFFLCARIETSVSDATDFLPHRPSGHFWLSASLPLGGPDSPARCPQDRAPRAVCCRIKFLSICLLSSRVSAQVGVAPDPFLSAPKRAGATARPLSSFSPISCCEKSLPV